MIADNTYTESQIARVLVRQNGRFPPRRYLAVENVSWGLLPWEADLLVMAKTGYLQEIEIKTSVADLKRDLHKTKHWLVDESRRHGRQTGAHTWIRRFWYAMPVEVWHRVAQEPPIPPEAGVIVIKRNQEPRHPWQPELWSLDIRNAKLNPDARKLLDDEKYDLARLGVLRYWDRIK